MSTHPVSPSPEPAPISLYAMNDSINTILLLKKANRALKNLHREGQEVFNDKKSQSNGDFGQALINAYCVMKDLEPFLPGDKEKE